MTTQKLLLRSIQKNIKLYYLYFFSMIFSISFYFIFSILQHDEAIVAMANTSVNFSTAFQVAGILLILITIVFTIYSTTIFIRRRSQEIGLYQLIGLSKAWVARVLILEHLVLGMGALLIGIVIGTLFSRLFLLLFMNIIGLDLMVGLGFSSRALVQTLIVFTCLILVTSLQIITTIYRSSLLQMFQANKQSDHFVKRPSFVSALLAITGIGLIVIGYYLSTLIVDYDDLLLFLMLLVLASTILGTYLVFHTTISWALYVFRKKQNGHLSLYNSLSIAPLMHRMKGHANSLTLITVLSAMTITMISLSYSLYYSTEREVRLSMPFDFALENMEEEASYISSQLEEEEIDFDHHQLDAIRFNGAWVDQNSSEGSVHRTFMLFSAEQLAEAGSDMESPQDGEAIYYNTRAAIEGIADSFPREVLYSSNDQEDALSVSESTLENLINFNFFGEQLLVSENTFESMVNSIQEDENTEYLSFDTFDIVNNEDLEAASTIFLTHVDSDEFLIDYYSLYEQTFQTYGLLIFIAGFLGFIFLLSTGSIVYFKQMTEAEQEREHYKTLRQLGFQVSDMMKGIIRKQLFVYLIPLGIGLLHSVFALNVGSILSTSSLVTPIVISMTVYVVIYLLFAVFTIQYYKSIVKDAL